MRARVLLAATFVLVIATPLRGDDDARRLPLWEAARDGLVVVSGKSVFEFRTTLVTIENRSKEPLRLDVLGSYFEPDALDVTHTRSAETPLVVTRDWVQPIGLGLLRKGDARSEVVVAAGAREETKVLSFCLEHEADPPDEKTPLHFVAAPMPKGLVKILDEWRGHLERRQEEVQDDIWHEGSPERGDARGLPAGATRVVVASGDVFALEGEVLWKGVPGRRLAPFAYPVLDVASNGAELHALLRASPNPKCRIKGPVVARYGGHSRWVEEVGAEGVARLLWAKNGALLAADAKGLVRATIRREVRELGAEPGVALDGGAVLVVSHEGGASTITRLAPHALRLNATTQAVAAVVSSVAVRGNVLVLLTDEGELLELEGSKRPVALRTKGTSRAVYSIDAGVVVESTEGLELLRPGKPLEAIEPAPRGARLLAGCGRLYARRGVELFQLDASTRDWDPVRFRSE